MARRKATKGTRKRPTRKPAVRRRAARAAKPRARVAARGIDARAKTLAIAAEPPIDRDPTHLVPAFRTRLETALRVLESAGSPFKFVEGFRTVERQQWLFGSGRSGVPFGRLGPIVTKVDGVTKRSNHQGDGSPGSGRAADCYPTRDGRVVIPAAADPVWQKYAEAVRAQGLTAGFFWPSFQDAPHCELPPD
jgi:hypothetical protein